MSRRAPNPAAERAAQNQQTIKSLLKLEANKICADCKRNKHPRWASWNLGVFVCIRCSGIHRGMGTHISRVKSVDLDSWTDEQLHSVVKWGNARANKYWEAKLATAHVPSESKIENFIRTKYELKRWVMDGGIPDPSTLDDEGDDDIPLSVVREKQDLERKASLSKGSKPASSAIAAPPTADLIGGDPIPQRASTAGPSISQVPAKAEPAPPKTTAAKDSLLGLDFLGSEPAAPPRPSSTTGTGGVGGQSRPDLKQSILSLYASAPRPQQQQPSHSHSGSFGGMQSPSSPGLPQQSSMGGSGLGSMNDAFSSLSFGGTTSPPPRAPAHDAFAGLGSISNSRSPPPVQSQAPPQSSAFSGLGSGSFFDTKPAPAPSNQQKPSYGGSSGFNGFGSPSPPAAQPSAPSTVPASAALGDLFDFGAPAPAAKPAPAPAAAAPAPAASSVFNLSSSTQPKPSTITPTASSNALPTLSSSNNWSNADVWGDSNAWGSSDTSATKAPDLKPSTSSFSSWGASSGLGGGGGLSSQSIVPGASGGFAPTVAADEEFGGWASSTGTSGAGVNTKPAGGVAGSEDLFSNVWQ